MTVGGRCLLDLNEEKGYDRRGVLIFVARRINHQISPQPSTRLLDPKNKKFARFFIRQFRIRIHNRPALKAHILLSL